MKIIKLSLVFLVLFACKKKEDKIETFTIEGNVYTECPGLPNSAPGANYWIGLIREGVTGNSDLGNQFADQNGYFKFEYEKDGEQDLTLVNVWGFNLPILNDIPANKNIRNLIVHPGDFMVPIKLNFSGAEKFDASDTLLIFINGSIKANIPGPFKNGFLIDVDHYFIQASYYGSVIKCTYHMLSEQLLHEVELKIPNYCEQSYEINIDYD